MTAREPRRGPIPVSHQRRPDRFCEWLLGLPWVFEHPLPEMDGTVHAYAIECADLSSPHIFAITGLTAGARSHVSVSVVVPRRMARGWQQARWGEPIIHLPANQLLVSLQLSLDDVDLERLTLVAYRHAFHSSELQ